MRRQLFFLWILTTGLNSQSFCQVLIKNVTVVDVENKKLLQGYDVMSAGGKIISIEKTRQDKPAGTTIIDGTGKYLIPGLTDAHVHFSQSGGLYTRPDAIDLRKYQPFSKEIKWVHDNMEDILRHYTSAGITSVVDVGSTYHFLAQRDSFKNKDYAPLISMTGPLLTTYVPDAFKDLGDDGPFIEMKTEEGARASVREQLSHKADFIKIWYIVLDKDVEAGARKNLAMVKAVIDEAHKNNLRVAVHATERITAQLAVEAGADFLVHNVDDEIITTEFVQLLKKHNTILCPTLVVADGYSKVFGHTYQFTTDELSLSNPVTVATVLDYPSPDTSLAKLYMNAVSGEKAKARQAHADSVSFANLQKLYAGGITIASGTDAGNIGTQHVGSYFVELKAMQDAGFKLWDLLVASTINGAKAVGKQNEWGSITKGKDANMVLLNANPLDSLSNWRKISVVISKGIVFNPDSLVNNTAEMLVQQQLNGYNAHNVEAFVAPYADDVEVFEFPNKLLFKGKEMMKKNYQFIINTPGLYCKVLKRIIEGNTIIDHEEVHISGTTAIFGIVIYEIEKGKIKKVYFMK